MTNTHPPLRRRTLLGLLAAAAAIVTTSLGVVSATATAKLDKGSSVKPTIVLVHGAFADSSSWNGVVQRLSRKGYNVIAPANPLRNLASDTQYLKDFLNTVEGPIVLVGHSYGGMVLTNAATGDPDVKALVYIAAFAPALGEKAGELSAGGGLGPTTLSFRPYTKADGSMGTDGYITPSEYRRVFAADVPQSVTWTMALTQRPADLAILGDPSGEPAWKTIPSWFMVAKNDMTIPPAAERMMAKRAGSTTIEVNASHSVAVSRPATVANFIILAAKAVS